MSEQPESVWIGVFEDGMCAGVIIPLPDHVEYVRADKVERLRQRVTELVSAVSEMDCTCLPHAKPNDGMCPRCMALLEADDE